MASLSATRFGKPIKVNAASVVDLKAELSKKTEEFEREKGVGAARRPVVKKPTVWTKQNTGVSSRAAKDEEAQKAGKKTWEESQETLLRGARMYEKLQRGEIVLTEEMEENVLVDFERKRFERQVPERSVDEDDDSATKSDDPWVEYEDEFGRKRTCRQSEVPPEIQELQRRREEDARRKQQGATAGFVRGSGSDSDSDTPGPKKPKTLVEHYDAEDEIRTRGVGFFQFSKDEAERQRQMKELTELRSQTLEERKKTDKTRGTSKLAARLEAAKKKQQLAAVIAVESNPVVKEQRKADVDDFLKSIQKEIKDEEAKKPPPFIPPPPPPSAAPAPALTAVQPPTFIPPPQPQQQQQQQQQYASYADYAQAYMQYYGQSPPAQPYAYATPAPLTQPQLQPTQQQYEQAWAQYYAQFPPQ